MTNTSTLPCNDLAECSWIQCESDLKTKKVHAALHIVYQLVHSALYCPIGTRTNSDTHTTILFSIILN